MTCLKISNRDKNTKSQQCDTSIKKTGKTAHSHACCWIGNLERVTGPFLLTAVYTAVNPKQVIIYGAHHLHQRYYEGLPSYQTSQSKTPSPSLAYFSVTKTKDRIKCRQDNAALIPTSQRHCPSTIWGQGLQKGYRPSPQSQLATEP